MGPALGGLVGSYGHHLPFIVAAVLTLSNFIFGLFVLPESLIKEKRKTKIDYSQMNPFKSVFKVLFRSNGTTLIWAFFLTNLAGQSHPSIWALYTHYKFGWNSLQVGLSLTVVGLAFGLGQGLSTRFITTKIGEYKSVIYGSCVLILAFFLYGIVEKAWMIYAVTSLLLFTGITMPSLQSLITKDGDAGLQGELQGTLVSLTSLTAILGPLIYTNLFAYYTHREAGNIPGAPYYADEKLKAKDNSSIICIIIPQVKTEVRLLGLSSCFAIFGLWFIYIFSPLRWQQNQRAVNYLHLNSARCFLKSELYYLDFLHLYFFCFFHPYITIF